ncbi:hypothetical protein IJ21_38670 [Paenibacillus sp. 32O-W]|nr:hypothetical protein IJ21_38670 [Paenibacillus sp. 32O-W]
MNVQLREGSTHNQKDGADFLRESIQYARRITKERLLVRMDSAHDSLENLQVCQLSQRLIILLIISSRSICATHPRKRFSILGDTSPWFQTVRRVYQAFA